MVSIDDAIDRQADVPLTVTKLFTFEAAHELPYHDGKCQRPHGHSYTLEVSLRGHVQPVEENNPQSGMVIDFGEISRSVKSLIDGFLDHQRLNETIDDYPTAERIVQQLVKMLLQRFGSLLLAVKLWETATGSVEWRRGA